VQIDGVPLHIVDTAGLRETADEVEVLGIARTWAAIETADLLILIVDAGRGVTAEDQTILARLPQGLPRLTIFNKTDLLQQIPRAQTGDHGLEVHLSAKTGAGLDLLKAEILRMAGWRPGNVDLLMARERHLAALSEAAAALQRASQALAQPEFLAEELRLAQASLSRITGSFTADDLLGEIFSRFCIGK
jgi:tRNA modification GTPase